MTWAGLTEFWLGSDPGVPLSETDRIPGTAFPAEGNVVASAAPGFGIETDELTIELWS